MSQLELEPGTAKGSVLMTLFHWLFCGLGVLGLFNLGSLLLTGSIWVHSGTRSQANWTLLNATDAPEAFLWGLFQLFICLGLGLLAVFLFFAKNSTGFKDVVYLDVHYSPNQVPQENALPSALRKPFPARLRPLTFSCQATLKATPSAIVSDIFNLSLWPSFRGYGPLPGIANAEFEGRPAPNWVGTRIRVENTDGSRHIETVTAWDGTQLVMELGSFSPPLEQLASHFVETWQFLPLDSAQTRVKRQFLLYPRSPVGRLLLKGIALMLKRAVQRHLDQMV
ncbi:MAG: SRPBCC family protein [Candidatus Sericytochromatia bacterium]